VSEGESRNSDVPGRDRWKYGLWAVFGGFGALIIIYIATLIRYPTPADAAAFMGPAVAAIGTLTAAYFGVQAGSAGKEQSDASKDAAHHEALRFAAIADPDRATRLLGLGPDDGGGGGGGPAAAATYTLKGAKGTRPPDKGDRVLTWGEEDEPPPTAPKVTNAPERQAPLKARAAGSSE
jgi:hypothetical protein